MRKSKGNAVVVVLIIMFLLAVSAAVYFYQKTTYLESLSSNSKTKASAPEQTTDKPVAESVKFLSLNYLCDNGPVSGFSVTLKKAYLIDSFADFPGYKLTEIQSSFPDATGLLALEADVRNLNVSGNTDGIYGSYVFRLRKGVSDYEPVIYGATMVAPQSNKILYTYFPVGKNDTSFQIMYCNFADHPSIINLDFNAANAQTLNGSYKINQGFTSSN